MLPPVDYLGTTQLLKLKPGIETHTDFCYIYIFNLRFCFTVARALARL